MVINTLSLVGILSTRGRATKPGGREKLSEDGFNKNEYLLSHYCHDDGIWRAYLHGDVT